MMFQKTVFGGGGQVRTGNDRMPTSRFRRHFKTPRLECRAVDANFSLQMSAEYKTPAIAGTHVDRDENISCQISHMRFFSWAGCEPEGKGFDLPQGNGDES